MKKVNFKKRVSQLMAGLLFFTFTLSINAQCDAGGPGSSSCSTSTGITFLGQATQVGSSVSCGEAQYACCTRSPARADCIPNDCSSSEHRQMVDEIQSEAE